MLTWAALLTARARPRCFATSCGMVLSDIVVGVFELELLIELDVIETTLQSLNTRLAMPRLG